MMIHMRPANFPSPDPNAPYRAAIQAMADGHAYVMLDETNPYTTSNVEASIPSSSRSRPPRYPSTNRAGSSQPQIIAPHIESIKMLLRQFEHLPNYHVDDQTMQKRLQDLGLTPETFLDALYICTNTDHPVMKSANAGGGSRERILQHLATICSQRGISKIMRRSAGIANNDPTDLVLNTLHFALTKDGRKVS